MDLGGGAQYHIAGLQTTINYTKTITLQSNLYIDVLTMSGGTIDGTDKWIDIWQKTQNVRDPATNFGTSKFAGGTIKVGVWTEGEQAHRVTLTLAGGGALTPVLDTALTTDFYTALEWRANDMTVSPGGAISLGGSFLADSTGTIGNNTANWTLILNNGSTFSKGKGTFNKVNVKENGGKTFKVASTIPGGNDVFVIIGTWTNDGGTTEVQSGTLSVQGDFTQTSGSTIVDSGQTLSVSGNVFDNGGTITLAGGTLAATAVQIAPGAELGGSGTLAADVTNAGVIDVGGVSAVGALQVNGNYTQTSTGILNVEISGPTPSQIDQLMIAGQANLGGTLNVSLLFGFVPSPGQVYSLLSYGSRSNTFATVNLPTFPGGTFDPRYDDPLYPNAFTLWVV